MTECSKTQIRLTGLKWSYFPRVIKCHWIISGSSTSGLKCYGFSFLSVDEQWCWFIKSFFNNSALMRLNRPLSWNRHSEYQQCQLSLRTTNDMCAQRRRRSAWVSIQSDQSLCCPHEETLDPWLSLKLTAKTLIRLGHADLSLRWTHRSFCWFCHTAAQLLSPGRFSCLAFSMYMYM